MLRNRIPTRSAGGARAPTGAREWNRTLRLPSPTFSLFALTVLALTVFAAPAQACTGASGAKMFRSQPSLRAQPLRISAGLPSAGLAVISNEPTLVILVQFSDQAGTTTQAAWNTAMFGGNPSLRDYYHEVSYYVPGASGLDLPPATEASAPANNGVAGWYTITYTNPSTATNYTQHPENALGDNWEWNTQASRWIAKAAVAAADADVNFAAFDNNPPDGFLSASELHIIVILAGYEDSYSNNPNPDTWRHHWSDVNGIVLDGVTVLKGGSGGGYSMLGELDPAGAMIEFGLVCHEMGHDLGLPDLYDTTGNSEGVGEWSLMGSGDWCNLVQLGDSPAHLDPWSKIHLGWVNPAVPAVDQFGVAIPQVETNPTVYKLWSRGLPNPYPQYFLVENRQRVGYDAGLVRSGAADGLMIWHVNEAMENDHNDYEVRKFIDVECADGLAGHIPNADDLDTRRNRGDSADPWYLGNDTDFYTSSAPDNRDYRDPNDFNTTVEVRNISASGNPMTADLKVGRTTFLGSNWFTGNGQTGAYNVGGANNTMRVYYLGWNCCGNTYVYEKNGAGAWVKVNTWNYNVPRHNHFVSGQEIRRQAGQWTGQFKLTSYALCGAGCDDPGDAGYFVDVYDGGPGGGSDPGNASLYPGWNIGFRDGQYTEFGSFGGAIYSFSPMTDGLPLTSFPRELGGPGVQTLQLPFTVTPNVFWERMRLQFVVQSVVAQGLLQVECPVAQIPAQAVPISGPGEYLVDLGWIRTPGTQTLTLSAMGGLDLRWDWLNLGTSVVPISLISPSDAWVTSSGMVSFDWSDLLNPASYEIQVDGDASFTSPDVDEYTASSSHSMPTALGDGVWYWRVRGSTAFGGWSEWTPPWNLRVDTQAPQISGTTVWANTASPGPYPVSSLVVDDGARVGSVSLYYRFAPPVAGASTVEGSRSAPPSGVQAVQNGWTELPMNNTNGTNASGDLYEGEIPGVPDHPMQVDYYVSASDFAGNPATDPPGAPGSYYSFTMVVGVEPGVEKPRALELLSSPNPFGGTVQVRYGLPAEGMVSLDIYDMHGRKVKTLVSGRQSPGYRTVDWNGRSDSGGRLPSGVYFCRLRAGNDVITKKMFLTR